MELLLPLLVVYGQLLVTIPFPQLTNPILAFQIEAELPLPPRTSHCNSHEQIGTDIGLDSAYPLLNGY